MDHASLDYVRKEIVKLWQTKAESEFQKIFEERDLKVKLDELDVIVEKAQSRKLDPNSESVNVTTLSPHELMKARSMPEKKDLLKQFETQLEELQSDNSVLQATVDSSKQEIYDIMEKLQNFIKDIHNVDDVDEDSEEHKHKLMVFKAVQELVDIKG